jgi:phosphate starvation-inducible protein PhoH
MRGRTFENAVVILDEAQNVTAAQMKMFLTRLGENVTVIVNGDITQCDLPSGVKSGLAMRWRVLRKTRWSVLCVLPPMIACAQRFASAR